MQNEDNVHQCSDCKDEVRHRGMEIGQKRTDAFKEGTTTSQALGINNSVRSAAIALCLLPETVAFFLPQMRQFNSPKPFDGTIDVFTGWLIDRCEELQRESAEHLHQCIELREKLRKYEEAEKEVA